MQSCGTYGSAAGASPAVHEQLLLPALDDEKGTVRGTYTELALAGAVLVDLLSAGAIEADGDRVRAAPGGAAPSGVLADAREAIAAEHRERDLRWWVAHLPGRMKPFVPRLAARLIGAGVLAEERHTVLGLFSRTRMPERDHAAEAQIVHRLRTVLLGAPPSGLDEAVLAALVGASDLIDVVVDKPDRDRARRRAEELGEGDQVGAAVRAAIKAARDAMTAAMIAATVATTAGTT